MNCRNKEKLRLFQITVLILCALTFQSYSQSTTTCIPNDSLNIAVQLIEIGKIDAKKVEVLNNTVEQLKKQLDAKTKQISAFSQREKTYENLVANYKNEIQLRSQSQDISTAWVTFLQRDLRKSRTKTVIVGIAGLIVSGITLYLTTK